MKMEEYFQSEINLPWVQKHINGLQNEFNRLDFPKIKALATYIHNKSLNPRNYDDYPYDRYISSSILVHGPSSFAALYFGKIGIVSGDRDLDFTRWTRSVETNKKDYQKFRTAANIILIDGDMTKKHQAFLKLPDVVLNIGLGLISSAVPYKDVEKYKIRKDFDELMQIRDDMEILLSQMYTEGLLEFDKDLNNMTENGRITICNKDLVINGQDQDWNDHLFLAMMTTSITPKDYRKEHLRRHSLSSIIRDDQNADIEGPSRIESESEESRT